MAFKHEPNNHQGNSNIWLTPKKIIDSLGPFDLDPCACSLPRPFNIANKNFTIEDNGLTLDWDGFVWCNPPYGKNTILWIKKLNEHKNGIALVFARTETRWFQENISNSSILLFPKKRISFLDKHGNQTKSNSGAPSVFIGYGDLAKKRILNSKIEGIYLSII